MLLSVDPGIRGCGVAAFALDSYPYGADSRDVGALVRAAYVASPVTRGADVAACAAMARAVVGFLLDDNRSTWALAQWTHLACEWPQVYTPGKQKGDPNDLLALVGVSAAVAALLPHAAIHTYLPAQWGGQTPKEVKKQRVVSRLTSEEKAQIWLPATQSLQHNVFDAIGIGLHHTGRFERHRVLPR